MKLQLHALLLTTSLVPLMGADGGCGPTIENNGFGLWCGERLCFWDLEEGEIERAETWHAGDSGVRLLGNNTAISQVATPAAECLRLEAVANVAETAEVTVEIDFFDTGVVDQVERIPTSSWEPISLLITQPLNGRGARFRIRKLGSGTAEIAALVIEPADKCVAPPAEIGPRPNGAICLADGDCESDICSPDDGGLCRGCLGDLDCPDGDVCGREVPSSLVIDSMVACTAARADPVGSVCQTDGECASGICFDDGNFFTPSVCSDCRSSVDCGGAACVETDLAWVCDGSLSPGAACSVDRTCASGSCTGPTPLRMCEDSLRPCVEDSDCGGERACVTVGIDGGTCE